GRDRAVARGNARCRRHDEFHGGSTPVSTEAREREREGHGMTDLKDTKDGGAAGDTTDDALPGERRITDEGVAELRSRLGAYYKSGPYRIEITDDDLRNFAISHGDWNPLFIDPDYGRGTRYGSHIAHPCFTDVVKHHTAAAIGA